MVLCNSPFRNINNLREVTIVIFYIYLSLKLYPFVLKIAWGHISGEKIEWGTPVMQDGM